MPSSFNASRVNLRAGFRQRKGGRIRGISLGGLYFCVTKSGWNTCLTWLFTFVACESLARKSKSHWLTAFCDTVVLEGGADPMPLKNPVHGARVSIWLMLIRLSEPDERRRMASPQPIPWEVRGCTKRPSQYSAPSPRLRLTSNEHTTRSSRPSWRIVPRQT